MEEGNEGGGDLVEKGGIAVARNSRRRSIFFLSSINVSWWSVDASGNSNGSHTLLASYLVRNRGLTLLEVK